jgi:hypothetical protein
MGQEIPLSPYFFPNAEKRHHCYSLSASHRRSPPFLDFSHVGDRKGSLKLLARLLPLETASSALPVSWATKGLGLGPSQLGHAGMATAAMRH